MGGADKGELRFDGKRLVDHVAERLAAQVERVLISGRHDFELGYEVVADRDDGPKGPAAGLWAVMHHLQEKHPYMDGFVTAPIDGPYAPVTLVADFLAVNNSAIATDGKNDHPTFAYWRLGDLEHALRDGDNPALHAIADACNADRVLFPSQTLINVNTPEELRAAARITP